MKMMGYKVIESFIDLQTGVGYNEGSAFVSDDAERVTFLISEGFLEGDAPKVKKPQTRKKAGA